MNDNLNTDESSHYVSVLASLTHNGENCIGTSPLHSEAFETEFVEVDDLAIVSSNSEISSKLASRLLSGELNVITGSSKSENILQNSCLINSPPHIIKPPINQQQKFIKSKALSPNQVPSKKNGVFIAKLNSNENGLSNSNFSTCTSFNNYLNVSLQKLPQQSTNNTAVEQPNLGPCSCFLCGQVLIDPAERCTYMNNQKLFGMKISLLELLSSIINQTVLTNTESIDLCQKCSDLMNEADLTFKRLHDLREEINQLFIVNKRPKLTFQILPKVPSSVIPKEYVLKDNNKDINLADLAYSRPRRGRASKKIIKPVSDKKASESAENEKPLKKKGGRPRKPFQCHICRRKFFAQSLVEKHLLKEHHVQPSLPSSTPISSASSSNPTPSSSKSIHSTVKSFTSPSIDNIDLMTVKVERPEEKDNLINKCNNFERESKVQSIIITQDEQETFTSPFSKSLLETLSSSGNTSAVRPIQPKPQTLIQTAVDGSLIYLMNPTTGEAAPTLIKVSPGYLNLKIGNHTCEVCQKTFLDERGYRMHKIAAHGTRKKKSDSDGSSDGNCNTSDESYSFHKMWQCNECTFVYFSKKELSDHRKSFHGKIINEDSQREHRREKIYSCNSCNLTFTYKYELEKHRETHLQFHKVGPHEFICHICGLKVASKAALKIHVHRFHTKDTETKDYLCAECGHMTSTKKSFADHLRIHSDIPGQKKVCHLCKKEMLSTSFKIHMIRMHGEAKHPCDICGQRFTLRSVLMKHLNTVHSTLTPYDCRLCSKKFVTAEALRYHKNKSHSSAMHSCMNCGKSFKWKGDLRSHMNKVHNIGTLRHTCQICSRSFTDKRKLELHVSLIHNRSTIKENGGDGGSKCSGKMVTQYESEEHVNGGGPTQEVIVSLPCTSDEHEPSEVHLISADENLGTLSDFTEGNSSLASIQSQLNLQRESEQIAATLTSEPYQTAHSHHIYVTTSHNEVLTSTIDSSFVQSHSKIHQPLMDQQMQSMYLVSDITIENPDKDS